MDTIKTEAEIAKLMAETVKINAEARWYPVAMVSAVVAAVAAVSKLLA
ncbi:hypothetical protein [Methyloversatilis discipulorum]|nr:hypothetical protein [Methyloversatilis discipulorum]